MSLDVQRFKMVLDTNQFNRIVEDEDNNYTVDVHEFHRSETKRLINNMINVVTHPCIIKIVHGYNRGTVLLEMIRKDLNNPKILKISTVAYNPGETYLEIA